MGGLIAVLQSVEERYSGGKVSGYVVSRLCGGWQQVVMVEAEVSHVRLEELPVHQECDVFVEALTASGRYSILGSRQEGIKIPPQHQS